MMTWNEGWFASTGQSGSVESIVVGLAEEVAAAARASAPVDTGAYRNSIHVEVRRTGKRVIAEVVASSDHALLVESRTGNLARSLRSVTGG